MIKQILLFILAVGFVIFLMYLIVWMFLLRTVTSGLKTFTNHLDEALSSPYVPTSTGMYIDMPTSMGMYPVQAMYPEHNHVE
jgi:autotransporter translocation and assembly factor TamB